MGRMMLTPHQTGRKLNLVLSYFRFTVYGIMRFVLWLRERRGEVLGGRGVLAHLRRSKDFPRR